MYFFISLQILCDICGLILDLCDVTTQFPWRTAVVTDNDHNDSILEDLCKTLSKPELRVYLEGMPSGSDHVITTDSIDDDEELELLLSPSKSTSHKDNDSNQTTTQSLKPNFIPNDQHLRDRLEDVTTITTINKIKVHVIKSQSQVA